MKIKNLIINLGTAEYAVEKDCGTIETSSVGSCVVVCLYDDLIKVGGLAHAMLPHRAENTNFVSVRSKNERPAKYVDEAIDLMINEMEKLGAVKMRLRAKIIGGAEMFKFLAKNHVSVGEENVAMARKILQDLHIPIVSEDTGGTVGRAVIFDLENGVLNVSVRM